MRRFSLLVAMVALGVSPLPARAEMPPLVPREVLFADPEQGVPVISPDGRWLAWSRRDASGISNLWVRGVTRDTSWQVTHDKRGIQGGRWTMDSRQLLYLSDHEGDEVNHIYGVEIASGRARDLTPFVGARAQDVRLDRAHPQEMLVGLNARDPRLFDLWRVDLATGAAVLDTQNPGDVIDWATDRSFQVRCATALRQADGATLLRMRDAADAPWREIAVWPFAVAGTDRARRFLGFLDDHTLLVQSSVQGNTIALVTMDAASGKVTGTIANDPACDPWAFFDLTAATDVPTMILSKDRDRVLAVAFNNLKPTWKALDPSVQPDLAGIASATHGASWAVTSADSANRRWVIEWFTDRSPGGSLLWDRASHRATRLFTVAPALQRWKFATMKGLRIRARDGQEIPCYLTLPPGVPAKRLPLVMNIHGGPWARDEWGWNPEVQWLANRGYAVLQVNYRASIGFGRDWINAGDHEFGPGKVFGDIVDATKWAIAQGIADPKRVGIMGWSFGGYATLCGLAFEPDLYACGVDGVGPSDIRALMQSFPAYWGPRKVRWVNRWGDAEHDDALNERLSPLAHVEAMRGALMIGHGLNDPRVKIAASERIVKALRDRGVAVDFFVYPDEGHGFARAENNQDFYGRAEGFLARHLGGRAEPARAVKGSSVEIR
jgi:dipeptidyl aminopeptidase/acylaminoacyl peptidase